MPDNPTRNQQTRDLSAEHTGPWVADSEASTAPDNPPAGAVPASAGR